MGDNQLTWREIQQQPALWPTTAERVREAVERLQLLARLKDARVVITGAGTSAYAAAAVAAAWPRSIAVPSTSGTISSSTFTSCTLPSVMERKAGILPRRSSSVCSWTAALRRRNRARTQIDGRRIQRIQALFQIDTKRFASIQCARSPLALARSRRRCASRAFRWRRPASNASRAPEIPCGRACRPPRPGRS